MAQQTINALVLGSIYTLFALGLTLSWGILGILNLAHGAVFMAGALTTWLVTKDLDVAIGVVLPVAIVVCGVLSVLLECLLYRPIRRRYADRGSGELGMLIASIGAAAVPVTIAVQMTDDVARPIPESILPLHVWTPLGLRISTVAAVIIVVAASVSIAVHLVVQRSKVGRALRALAFDPETCELMGIAPSRLANLTMFASGALAGVAGVLLSVYLGAMSAHMADPLLLKAFAVIILGGVGSVLGSVFSAYLLAFVETVIVVYFDPGLKDVVAFLLIIVLLLVRPQGLFARASGQRA